MRIRVSDHSVANDLSEFLRTRVGAIVESSRSGPGGPAVIEVSLLGSYGEQALRDEIAVAVRRWMLIDGHNAVVVELE